MIPLLFSPHQPIICATAICQKSLAADAVLVAQTVQPQYQAPIVITTGGTYSGNWRSLNPSVPAVTISTTAPVVIENSNLQGRGDLIQATSGNANLTIRNTSGSGLNPNVYGQSPGNFLMSYKAANIVVENCYLENLGGIKVWDDGSATKSVRIRYNRARNINGLKSNGNNGFLQDDNFTNFIQLNQVQKVAGIEIAWNEVINQPYVSAVEDNISIYLSSGTSSSPILVHDNYVQGAFPPNPLSSSYSGGGIMAGDGDANNISQAAGFVRVYNNQVVGALNYGIDISGGHDIELYNNRIISSGLLPDGTRAPTSSGGSNIWDFNNNIAKGTFYNNFAHDNTYAVVSGNGKRQDWWLPDCASGKCTNNTVLPNPITLATEQAEYQTWLNKIASNNVAIGPISVVNTATATSVAISPNSVVNTATATSVAISPDSVVNSTPLNRSGWSFTASSIARSDQTPDRVFDGNYYTRWSTGLAQANGQYFQVDLGSTQSFNKLVLDATNSPNDYPRGYAVYVSNDAQNWGNPVATGSGSSTVTTITFPTQSARYIKIVQTGSSTDWWWSIGELNIYNGS